MCSHIQTINAPGCKSRTVLFIIGVPGPQLRASHVQKFSLPNRTNVLASELPDYPSCEKWKIGRISLLKLITSEVLDSKSREGLFQGNSHPSRPFPPLGGLVKATRWIGAVKCGCPASINIPNLPPSPLLPAQTQKIPNMRLTLRTLHRTIGTGYTCTPRGLHAHAVHPPPRASLFCSAKIAQHVHSSDHQPPARVGESRAHTVPSQ